MRKDYTEEAQKLEREAKEENRTAEFFRRKNFLTKYEKFKKESSKIYEKSGDTWVAQFNKSWNDKNFRDAENSLYYAVKDYGLAMKFAESIKEMKDYRRIKGKKRSIRSKMDSLNPKKRSLEKRFVFAILSMVFLLSALFFSAFSLTGYSVSWLTNESFRFGGVILFALGLVFAFFYFKGKK